MKVKVSKVMATYINKVAKELGFKCSAKVVTMPLSTYKNKVSYDVFAEQDAGDYDWKTGLFNVICVTYPDSYYSMPQFLTTRILNKEFQRLTVKDEAHFKAMLRDLCEI